MPQPNTTQLVQKEGRIALAISAVEQQQLQTLQRAAATYNVPVSTLRTRYARVTSRRDCEATSKKLTTREELVIKEDILELDSRGFSPKYSIAQDIADKLLAQRSRSQVGKNWPANFVRRTLELKMSFNC
jgi:hypothetical protein